MTQNNRVTDPFLKSLGDSRYLGLAKETSKLLWMDKILCFRARSGHIQLLSTPQRRLLRLSFSASATPSALACGQLGRGWTDTGKTSLRCVKGRNQENRAPYSRDTFPFLSRDPSCWDTFGNPGKKWLVVEKKRLKRMGNHKP